MSDEVIAVRGMNGHVIIAVREPDMHQFLGISPPRYVARAEVWDVNDIPDVARAFGWQRPEDPCPECGGQMESFDLRNGMDEVVSSHARCRNCGYKEEDDEE